MKPDVGKLRKKAEQLLKKKSKTGTELTEIDKLILIHELEVHQIELELQNEELLLAKEQAEISAEKYIELYDFAPAGYFTLKSDGIIIRLNLIGSQMLGKVRSGLINKPFGFFVSPDTLDPFNRFINKIFNSGVMETCDLTLNSEGRPPLYAQLTGKVMEDKEHCLISAVDVTRRKLAEDELLEMQKQILHAEKLEAIGLIAGGVAHDFNNLLSVVLGNLEYLDYIKIENPEITIRIDNAKHGIIKLAVIIKQLMAYSGKGIYQQKKLDIGSLINENLVLFRAVAGKKNLLETNLQDKLPFIKGDKNELLQIMVNLLYNACEAIGDNKGIIGISTGVAYFDLKSLKGNRSKASPGNYVFIRVADNGCGMDQVTAGKIFEPFFTTKFVGHGLSMPSAQGVLSSHLGGILLDSELNKGSTVTILLPPMDFDILPEKITIEKKIEHNKISKFNGTILIAEDELLLLEISSDMLQLMGFKVLKANDGLEALELFKENHGVINGIMLDITMPRMGGVEAAKAILELDKDIRIIFASGYDVSDKSLGIDSVNYKAFLHKPYTMENLIVTLTAVFDDLLVQ